MQPEPSKILLINPSQASFCIFCFSPGINSSHLLGFGVCQMSVSSTTTALSVSRTAQYGTSTLGLLLDLLQLGTAELLCTIRLFMRKQKLKYFHGCAKSWQKGK